MCRYGLAVDYTIRTAYIIEKQINTWSGVAVFPVPIAQTGSYAMTILDQSAFLAISASI